MNFFEELKLSHQLLSAIKKLGFTKPTEIQRVSIPPIMQRKDVIGESATGSGKTLAFGCGLVDNSEPKKGIQALILTPTRELALQVRQSIKDLLYKKPLNIVTIYGGVPIDKQIHDLPKAEVVVATPGRLLDHLNRRTINLSKVKFLVLDEADRMLDMGFIDDVEKIIRNCPRKRQTLFFSATISTKIQKLADRYMSKPIRVSAKNQVDPNKLKQVYYNLPSKMKLTLLDHLLEKEKVGLAMVFCNTRRNTDFVVKNIKAHNINAIAIHGGLAQNKRTKTMDWFNKSKFGVLVCTDVAARGLHIDNVSHVYNYDLPKDPKDYVHRIGRTARAGEKGKVINLLCEKDHDNFSRILSDYKGFKIKKIEVPRLQQIKTIRTDRRKPFSKRGNSSRGGQHSSKKFHRKRWNV